MPQRDEQADPFELDDLETFTNSQPAEDTAAESPNDGTLSPDEIAQLYQHQNMLENLGVESVPTALRVRTPSKEWFVRVHPDPAYRLRVGLIALKDQAEREDPYLVTPALWAALATEPTFSYYLLHLAQSRQYVRFLWPVRIPTTNTRGASWHHSALEAAALAQTRWVRLFADQAQQKYTFHQSTDTEEPPWPLEPFTELLTLAFGKNVIRTREHVILQRLLQGKK